MAAEYHVLSPVPSRAGDGWIRMCSSQDGRFRSRSHRPHMGMGSQP